MSRDLERCECGARAIGAVNHGGGVREPICGGCLERVTLPVAAKPKTRMPAVKGVARG